MWVGGGSFLLCSYQETKNEWIFVMMFHQDSVNINWRYTCTLWRGWQLAYSKNFWKPGHWLLVFVQGVSSVGIEITQTWAFCSSQLIRPDMEESKCCLKKLNNRKPNPNPTKTKPKNPPRNPSTIFFSSDVRAIRNYVFSCSHVLSLIIHGWSPVVTALDWLLVWLDIAVLMFPSPRSSWTFLHQCQDSYSVLPPGTRRSPCIPGKEQL